MNLINSNKNSQDEYKNDLFIIFLDRLLSLYNQKKYNKVSEILIGTDKVETYKYAHKNGNSSYYDETSIVIVRIWTDNETKKLLDCLYYICTDENVIISLNNKIIRLWLYSLSSSMNTFFYNTNNKKIIECNKEHRLRFKIQKSLWDDFIKKCKILGITASEGFKSCIDIYMEQKSNIHL